MSYRNHNLGTFQLQGIPPAPRGVPQVEVTFDIDANGIVNVSAKDLGTGQEQQMTITGGTALSKDEIDRMMKEAESHAEEDKARREEVEVRNNADQLVWQTEKLLAEQGESVNDEEKKNINEALDGLKKILADQAAPLDQIQEKHDALISSSQSLRNAFMQLPKRKVWEIKHSHQAVLVSHLLTRATMLLKRKLLKTKCPTLQRRKIQMRPKHQTL